MPTYEYTCRDCGHTFDIVQSMWDEPLTMCPECGGSLRKVFAPPAISFKGSGFYATDHRKKAKETSGDAKEGAAAKGGRAKKDTAAADSTPAAEPPSTTTKKEPAAP
jgi:putative FmdB family regulatory protein